MTIKINTVHFNADKKLEDFVQQKVGKLSQFYNQILSAEVFLTLEKVSDSSVQKKNSKIKLDIPGVDVFAEKSAETFEEATDLAIDALKKQIIKLKEKQRS